MKKTLLFIFSLLTLSLLAQDIKFDVLSNAGGRISNVNSASFTFGQTFVGTKTNGTNSIRQGFQQPSFMMSVAGCMDPLASNYNPLANIDDGSCCYVNISQNDTTICFGESLCLEADAYQNVGTNNSLSFNAPSNAIGKDNPLPKNIDPLASRNSLAIA